MPSRPYMTPANRAAVRPRVLDHARATLRHLLDTFGVTAFAYDARAHLSYLLDRGTRARNARLRASIDDELPLPPPRLVYSVAGHFDLGKYHQSGLEHAELLRRVLKTHGHAVEDFGSLLDFGCGSGRVVRQWRDLPETRVHGCDYNARHVAWCRQAIPFAEFRLNRLTPPLPYGPAEFDFVYAISVFTHLTEELQLAWIRELERVLSPGGVLLITTKGRSRLEPLSEEERQQFERGELVVQSGRYAGRNLCAAYHPERYVNERLKNGLNVFGFVPAVRGGTQTQDIFMLEKPRAFS
jgi:SAM-dependent methyltransferase